MTKIDSPWNTLGLSRSQYFASAPWKRAKMKREKFEEFLRLMPPDFTANVRKEADAEELVLAMFKQL